MAYTLKYTLIDNDTHYSVSGYTGTPVSVTIPATYEGKSVTSIGYRAFYNCTNLTSVIIGNSVTSIDDWAFEDCSSLTSVEIPNSVTRIGNYAFSGCTNLTSVSIPNSVKSISDGAFRDCTSLTSVEIPNSVTSIGSWAFVRCDSLTSVSIPNSVKSISYHAFEDCTSLTSIEVDANNTAYSSLDGNLYSKNKTILIQYAIGKQATSFTIPNSVTRIESRAFYNCTNLTSVSIPNSVKSISDGAFGYCSSLTSIEIPNSVTSIGNSAFYNCSSLTSIEIPNSVTSIGNDAFGDCSNLQYNIKDGLKYLGNSQNPYLYLADTVSESITTATIESGCRFIGNYVFYNCTSLISIEIPNSVTRIGEDTFSYCRSLTSITIPNSVKRIGIGAFAWCSNLSIINILSKTPANLASNGFNNIKSTAKFYCYSSALEAYKTATNWSSYKDKFVADDIRLTFINSANAQKNYFASKDEIKTLQNKADIIYVDNKFNEVKNDLTCDVEQVVFTSDDYNISNKLVCIKPKEESDGGDMTPYNWNNLAPYDAATPWWYAREILQGEQRSGVCTSFEMEGHGDYGRAFDVKFGVNIQGDLYYFTHFIDWRMLNVWSDKDGLQIPFNILLNNNTIVNGVVCLSFDDFDYSSYAVGITKAAIQINGSTTELTPSTDSEQQNTIWIAHRIAWNEFGA